MNKVEVLDSIMGSSKSTKIIEWMATNTHEKYLYVSPLLSEVDVDTGRLSALNFLSPNLDVSNNKSDSLYRLLLKGKNICCTHSLYTIMTKEHFELIRTQEYIVVIDEEINTLTSFTDYCRNDLIWLYSNYHIAIDKQDGKVSWINREPVSPEHKYAKIKQLCDSERLYASSRDYGMMVVQLPIMLFEAAKRTIVLTYLFDGNILDCFLRLRGFEIIPFTEVVLESKTKEEIKKLITFCNVKGYNGRFELSSGWYEKASSASLKALSNSIRNMCLRYRARANNTMWTLPSKRAVSTDSRVNCVYPKGFSEFYTEDEDGNRITNKCWIGSNIRATNQYADRWMLVHAYNRFPLTPVSSYLADYGFPLDADRFALSEMVQWVWRSRIRNGEPIVLAIASKRMYNLFNQWLEQE